MMLRNLMESKLSTNLLIIQDSEEIGGEELFVTFLKKYAEYERKSVHLMCYENPPDFYLKHISSTNIKIHNFFCDPCGWDETCPFTANFVFSDSVFFIDSLSTLTTYNGLCAVYKWMSDLKTTAKKVVCLAHGDILSSAHLHEFKDLSSTFIAIQPTFMSDQKNYKNLEKKIVSIIHKKVGGKVIIQREICCINSEFKVTDEIYNSTLKSTVVNRNLDENLTTFKIHRDKKVKDQLIFPFLRAEIQIPYTGKIIYKPETDDDLEDDPDDDLNI